MTEEDFVQIIDDSDEGVQVLGYEPFSSEEGEVEVTSFELDGDSAVIIDIEDEPYIDSTDDTATCIDSDIDTFTSGDIQ